MDTIYLAILQTIPVATIIVHIRLHLWHDRKIDCLIAFHHTQLWLGKYYQHFCRWWRGKCAFILWYAKRCVTINPRIFRILPDCWVLEFTGNERTLLNKNTIDSVPADGQATPYPAALQEPRWQVFILKWHFGDLDLTKAYAHCLGFMIVHMWTHCQPVNDITAWPLICFK